MAAVINDEHKKVLATTSQSKSSDTFSQKFHHLLLLESEFNCSM